MKSEDKIMEKVAKKIIWTRPLSEIEKDRKKFSLREEQVIFWPCLTKSIIPAKYWLKKYHKRKTQYL